MTVSVGGGNCGSSHEMCALGAAGCGGLCTVPHCRQGRSSAAFVGFRLMWSQCQTLGSSQEVQCLPTYLPIIVHAELASVELYWLGNPFSWLSIPLGLFQRHLLLGRKAMTNLDHILKSRDITLPTKVHIVKAVVFLVVMCGCENWTIKNAEH